MQLDKDLLLKDEVYQIVGAAMEVLNILGHGLLEKNYENALCVEFDISGVSYQKQRHFEVHYKNEKIGEYIPDIIVYDSIVVETKTIEKITDFERGQIINYLKITNKKVGVILNFKKPKLEWERVVLSY